MPLSFFCAFNALIYLVSGSSIRAFYFYSFNGLDQWMI
jgi:hypothetical protein